MQVNDVVKITENCSAILVGCDKIIDVPKNSLAKILSFYSDEGFWSDENPVDFESPFPSARLFLLSEELIIDSVHVKLLDSNLE